VANTLMSLLVKLGLDSSDYKTGLSDAEGQAKSSSSSIVSGLSAIGGAAVMGGLAAAAGGVAAITGFLGDSVKEAQAAEGIQSQLAAVLKSTGGAAGVTADEINEMASNLSNLTGIEDDTIVSGQNMLLTFTNIGKDVFPETTQTMLDMSAAMGQDLKSSALQLGKALNDPTQGMTALTRVGVTFTDEQKKMIESLQTSGDMAGAQKIILAELAREFGGSASAAGNTFSGTMNKITNQIGNLKEEIGGRLLPELSKMINIFVQWVETPYIQSFIKQFTDGIVNIATVVISNIPVAFNILINTFNWLSQNQGVIVGALAAIGVAIAVFAATSAAALWTAMAPLLPVIAVMAAVGLAAYALYEMWNSNFGNIQGTVNGLLSVFRPIFDAIVSWLQVNIPLAIQTMVSFWNGTLLPAFMAVGGWINDNLMPLFQAIGNLIGAVLKKDFEVLSAVFNTVFIPAIKEIFKWLNDNLMPILAPLAAFIGEKLVQAFGWLGDRIKEVAGFINGMANALNGLSLPSWLTPGSPTPFEMGLRGISDAMGGLTSTELPKLSTGLDIKSAPPASIARESYNYGDGQQTKAEYTGPSAAEIGRQTALAFIQMGLGS